MNHYPACVCICLYHTIMEEEERDDSTAKASRRDRFKGAIARTRTKLTKRDKDSRQDVEVEDFLSAGRNSTSTGRPSVSDSLSFASERPPTSDSRLEHPSPESITRDAVVPLQPSPRRIVVPKIDVSRSQRFPAAQPLHSQPAEKSEFLRPQYKGRSQSASSFAKGRGRARGLSVQFTEKAPIVIGEGGDESHVPTIEVSMAKARARSLSPAPTPREAPVGGRFWSRSPKRKPVPEQAPRTGPQPEDDFTSSGLRRVQTGMSPGVPESKLAMEKEFEMSLGPSSASTMSPGSGTSPQELPLHAPRPVRPPVAYPAVETPAVRQLKAGAAQSDLRSQFKGDRPPTPPPHDQHYEQPQQGRQIGQPRFYESKQPIVEERGRPRAVSSSRQDGRSLPDKHEGNWI